MRQQMRPIHGQSAAKRLKWGSAQNVLSWAYMKMMREGNANCRVYPENPYVEVYPLRENLYGLFNQNNDGAGDVWMYLLIGPEKAMVIDTACGLGDQRALIDRLTGGMPLIVVNTHLGPDHSFGNVRFDTVYCHEYEVENIRSRVRPGMFDYLFDEEGRNIWLQFDKKDLPEYREYQLIGVPDGYTWDLGSGYEVELIWTGGHAAGHAMYLDKRSRLLFAGDDVCSDVIACGGGPREGMFYNQYRNVETYRNRLAYLVGRIDEFDVLFPGHFMINLESHLLLDLLDALNEILSDPHSYHFADEYVSGDGLRTKRMYRCVKGFGAVAYTEAGIFQPGGRDTEERNQTEE